mgnify:CR=1 FL=1
MTDAKYNYSDMNLNFLPNGMQGPFTLTGYASIRESLMNILFTDMGSRFFNRSFGNVLQPLLFENINELTARSIQMILTEKIPEFEPRVEVDPFGIQVIPDYEKKAYFVTLNVREKGTNQPLKLDAILKQEI